MDNLKGKTVLILGDSIMFGSGNNGFGVGEYLEKDLGLKSIKYAVGGARVGYVAGKSWIVEQVRKVIKDNINPDYIVFDGLTNDCNQKETGGAPDIPLGEVKEGYSPENIFDISQENTNYSDCFQSIVCTLMAKFPNAKILFVRPHNMGRRDDKLQKEYGERALYICKKWGIACVDLYSESGMNTFIPEHRDLFTFDSYKWGKGDCTHPNALGYELKYMPLIESKLKSL